MKDYEAPLKWLNSQKTNLVEALIDCSNINSGTLNLAGLAKQQQRLTTLFEPLDAKVEVVTPAPLEMLDNHGRVKSVEVGAILRFTKRPEATKQVLLCGHMDTVFASNSPFQKAEQMGEKIMGPGVADMKGGLMVILGALGALERYEDADKLGWEVIINADEETGSLGSAPYISKAAQGKDFGLVFEAALDEQGTLAGARKGSGKISLAVIGRSAHAGREFEKGANANIKLAEIILALHALNGKREGLTINIGKIEGGDAENMVSGHAVARIDVRYEKLEDKAWLESALQKLLTPFKQDTNYQVIEKLYFTREPKELSGKTQKLFDEVIATAKQCGQDLKYQPTGGVCDGNILAAAGLPNVDTLGVLGRHTHTMDEYMLVDSLAERAKLTAMLLMRYASGEWSI